MSSPRDSPVGFSVGINEIDGPIHELSSAISSSVLDLAFVGGLLFVESTFRERRSKQNRLESAFVATQAQPSRAGSSIGSEALDFTGTIVYDDMNIGNMKSRQDSAVLPEDATFEDLVRGNGHSQLLDHMQQTGAYRPITFFL